MLYAKHTYDDVLTNLHARSEGLTEADVEKRRAEHGYNELPTKKHSLIKLFFQQFNDVLVYILLAALGLSIAVPLLEASGEVHLESFLDAAVILAILLLNAILGFVQEYRAEQAIEMLQKLSAPTTHVRRNGKEQIIPSRDVVPGDIVLLEAGDKISADGRLGKISHLRTNESSLTGETQAVAKTLDPLENEVSLGDRKNMVFSGTLVSSGAGEYIVTATGTKTEIGKIAKLVSETIMPETPLQSRMKQLGQLLGFVVLALCCVVVLIGWFHNRTFLETMLVAVSLAVSAVPEGLPAVVTVCFAVGVRRMVKKQALVRRLDALETLGSVTVICSDKTGTITENKMKVVESWVPDESEEQRDELAQVMASCNRAQLPDIGDPTEIGLLEFAEERGVERLEFDEEEVPFTSEEKYMQTRHGEVSFLKGAPEKIVTLCDDVEKDTVMEHNHAMAENGLRVLACALTEEGTTRFIGLVGMEDPPRKSVDTAIKEAASAGIRTIMITGDNIDTAKAIARKVGIKGEAIEGVGLDALDDETLKREVNEIGIFARVSPDHKLRILKALQDNGEIVAMSGDGVNDAPALKGAHVGVAMGKVGTQVAREAASIVLADDHFSTIVTAIREGRRIYDNIRKFVLFLLRTNFDEILFITTTLMLDMPLPYLPIHILWINLMTDGLPALALSQEKAEPDVMTRPPRPSEEHLLSGEWIRLIIAALMGFLYSFFLYSWLLSIGTPLVETRSVSFTFAIVFELFVAFSVRSRQPLWKVGFFGNKWLIGAVCVPLCVHFIILYTPLSSLFRITGLSWFEWLLIVGLSFSAFMIFELLKLVLPGVSVQRRKTEK